MPAAAAAAGELLPDLLARCRRGERDALDTLVRRFHAYATAIAGSYLSRTDQIDDAVQSSFVTVLTHLSDLRAPDAFPGWLRQVVRTHCTRLIRGRHPMTLPADSPAVAPSPLDHVAAADLRDLVRRAVADLPPAQRTTAEMYYLDDLSQSDIAAALSIPQGTVKRRLHDARNTLRATLRNQLPL